VVGGNASGTAASETRQPTTRRRESDDGGSPGREPTVTVRMGEGRRARPECASARVPRDLPAPETPSARPHEEPLTALAAIELSNVTRSFVIDGRGLAVLDGVDLQIASGSVVAVVGPNGSGKSTLLRVMAGLVAPDSGRITIDGRDVKAADERVGLVFQEPRLLPWRRAIDNVAFPLELAGVPSPTRRERALALLDLVGMKPFAEAYPHQLSGGMRQRAAIARALALDPQILLLDEPFSALDALTRERFDSELIALWQRIGATVVVVTHSISESVFLADEVVVLSPRPARVVARVPVPLPRPRTAQVYETPAFAHAAAQVRAHLSGSPVQYAAEEAAAAPVRDVLERVGSPAWFDPFGSGG
jgi:NitT/TauT family transport system ATP-binding protein